MSRQIGQTIGMKGKGDKKTFHNLLPSHFHLNLSLIFENLKSAVHCQKNHENRACHRWSGCNGIMSETKTKHTVCRSIRTIHTRICDKLGFYAEIQIFLERTMYIK